MRTLAVIFLLIYYVDYSIGDRITDDAVIVEGEFLSMHVISAVLECQRKCDKPSIVPIRKN